MFSAKLQPQDPATRLTVLAPGLLGPLPMPPEPAPATPAFDLFLRYADPVQLTPPTSSAPQASRAGAGMESGAAWGGVDGSLTGGLLQRFGAVGSAPYARAADDPSWDRRGYLMHADPVHLRADRDQLRLFDAAHLGISRDEADALVAEINALIATDGLRLVAPQADRWYLELPEWPRLETDPLEVVNGHTIDRFLPTGPDAAHWAALMTEVQMLLFQSSVNLGRERRGRPMVNGLWLSGAGQWQALATPCGWQRLYSGAPLARGLAEAAGIEAHLPTAAEPLPGSIWAVETLLAARQALGSWQHALARLDADLQAALGALRAGQLSGLELDLCDGRGWQLARPGLRRFWRRRRLLASMLSLTAPA